MTALDPVLQLAKDLEDLREFLIKGSQPSFASIIEDQGRKTLLLGAASYFEYRLSSAVLSYVASQLSETHPLYYAIRIKAVDRRYHDWFDWASNNANRFFSIFGPEFKTYAEKLVKQDVDLNESILAFLELGRLRNQLVHQDFATFTLEKTISDILIRYRMGTYFVERVPVLLADFGRNLTPQSS